MISIVILCSWVAQIAYTLCFIPQIFTNYRVKCGRGVSEMLLFGYLNLLMFSLFYIFLLDLPMAYKICVPIQLAFVLIMIVQRLWYDAAPLAKTLGMVYLTNLAVVIAAIPFALANPMMIGSIGGWGNVVFGILSQAPQAIKIWQEKSVMGFDKNFVYACFMGGITEFAGALVGALPLQTKISSFRLITFCSVFLWQFKLYANNNVESR